MHIASIGIDLGKTTLHLVALGERNKVLVRKKFSRAHCWPDTFAQTVTSINFKPLAVRRRTIHSLRTAQRAKSPVHDNCIGSLNHL